MKHKVNIITNIDSNNYGSLLQAFALNSKFMEYNSDVINPIYVKEHKKDLLGFLKYYILPSKNHYSFIDKISIRLSRKKYSEKNRKLSEFIKKNFQIRKCNSLIEARRLIEDSNLVIAGSDQIWNPNANMLSEFTLLDFFENENIIKASYASSLVVKELDDQLKVMFEKALKSFYKISVREKSTISLLKSITEKNIRNDIDPTLLYDVNFWEKLTIDKNYQEDYIFVYMLRPEPLTMEVAQKLSEKYNLKIKICSNRTIKEKNVENIYNAGIEDFLTLIRNAKYIVTNSFHGSVFSIIFRKKFLSVAIKGSESRVMDLLKMTNLEERLIKDVKNYDKIDENIEWKKVDELLESERNKSIKYIEELINHCKTHSAVLDDETSCTGCELCKNVCPRGAIEMIADEKGFSYPRIDNSKCIKCGLCQKMCPTKKELKKNDNISAYAAITKDKEILYNSSSGGIFSEISKYVLNEKGVIYGASQNKVGEDFVVEHIRIDNLDELKKLNGSKYSQSSLKNVFNTVKKDLDDGKKVLFSGTACQMAAIDVFLKKDYDNLIKVEIFCHGVPNERMYNDFLRKKENNNKIIDYEFRTKKKGWKYKFSRTTFQQKNGKIINRYKYSHNESFYYLFLKSYILRESCYLCHYSGKKRLSDISLGDYWGFELFHHDLIEKREFSNKDGISCVLINTKKGKEVFSSIKPKLKTYETSIDEIAKCQSCLNNGEIKPKEYEIIMENYKKNGYAALEQFYNNKKKKNIFDIVKGNFPMIYMNMEFVARKFKNIIKKSN